MLEALAGELPEETIRFSSKVVHIQLSGHYKLVHLSDGTILKTKVVTSNYSSCLNNLRLVLLPKCEFSERHSGFGRV